MLLANAAYRVRPWRNGQGVTRDIAADDGWQLSLADITRSGRFSDFGDSVRHFAIVAGAVILRFAGGRAVACDPSSPVLVFDGGEAPECEVTEGPAQALNLIVQAGRFDARLDRLALGAGLASVSGGEVASGMQAIFVQSGRIECRTDGAAPADAGRPMDAGDSFIVTQPLPAARLLLRAVAAGGIRKADALVARVAPPTSVNGVAAQRLPAKAPAAGGGRKSVG